MPRLPTPRAAFFVLGCAAWLASAPAEAGRIALRWDPAPGASGYRVYLGTEPGVYTASVDVGGSTSAVVDTPTECETYHLAVRSYNAAGESAFSAPVQGLPQPRIDAAFVAAVTQGESREIEIAGANFPFGASLALVEDEGSPPVPTDAGGRPLISIDQVVRLDCRRLRARVRVDPVARGFRAMPVGTLVRDVELDGWGPGTPRGVSPLSIAVRFDAHRADVNRADPLSVDRVDGSDLSWLNYSHGSAEGDPHYLADADLDGDGRVDGDDLALLATWFGSCWDGAQWAADDAACE